MEILLFAVVMINGKMVVFEAEEVETIEDRYVFTSDGEIVAEFERKNIAGYFKEEIIEEDEEDEY